MKVLAGGTNSAVDGEQLGGSVAPDAAPAAVGLGSGSQYVLVRGGDGALWQKYNRGAGSGWSSLGGRMADDPGVVAAGPGRLVSFAKGAMGGSSSS